MANKDHYKTIGVAESASADEIKKAYRKLAKKYHPDVTGGDKAKEARFKEITEAYETVGDAKKRAAYDEARRNPFAAYVGTGGGGATGVPVDIGDLFSQFGRSGRGRPAEGSFTDIFEMFGGETKRGPRRGQDTISKLEIELPEAAMGAEKEVTIDGKRLKIKIPAGVSDGNTIRLTGQGEPGGKGAPAGDLLIELRERAHSRFRRRSAGSADIEVDIRVPVDVAILGGKVEIPTLEGSTVTLTIPSGTSSGKELRLRGKGAATTEGRGDLFAKTQLEIPSDLSPRAKELLLEFAKSLKR